MARQLPSIVASIALLGGASLAGLALWRAAHETPPAAPAAVRLPGAEDRRGPERIAPRPLGPQERSVAGSDPGPAPSRVGAGVPTGTEFLRRVVVRGRVSAPVERLEEVLIALSGSSGGSFELHADRHGRFEVDVTPLLGNPGPIDTSREILVEAWHRLCRPTSARLSMSTDAPAQGDASAAGAQELVLQVSLVLGSGTLITGRVALASGERGARAVVKAFPRTFLRSGEAPDEAVGRQLETAEQALVGGGAGRSGGWPPSRRWLAGRDLALARVAEDGTFAVQVQPGARYAVVAAARGLRPRTLMVDVPVEGRYVLDFVLEPGELIAGTLRLGSAGAGAEHRLQALLDRGSLESLGSGLGSLSWVDGAFEWRHVQALTDADGRFELGGLGPHSYDLRVLGLGVAGQHLRSVSLGRFEAPAGGLEFGPLLAEVELDFGPGAATPTAFRLRPVNSATAVELGPFEFDERGLALVSLPPHAVYEVLVGEAVVGRVATGAAGRTSAWRLQPPR